MFKYTGELCQIYVARATAVKESFFTFLQELGKSESHPGAMHAQGCCSRKSVQWCVRIWRTGLGRHYIFIKYCLNSWPMKLFYQKTDLALFKHLPRNIYNFWKRPSDHANNLLSPTYLFSLIPCHFVSVTTLTSQLASTVPCYCRTCQPASLFLICIPTLTEILSPKNVASCLCSSSKPTSGSFKARNMLALRDVRQF